MQQTVEKNWQIPNRMEALADISKEVVDWLADMPMSSRAKYSAGLAIEEMVTNAIKYAYDDDQEHVISIHILIDLSHLKLIFEDDGHPFDPTQRPTPDVESIVKSSEAGGLGIELVRRMCEKMTYKRVGGRNRITLHIRKLEPDDTQFLSLSSLLAP